MMIFHQKNLPNSVNKHINPKGFREEAFGDQVFILALPLTSYAISLLISGELTYMFQFSFPI